MQTGYPGGYTNLVLQYFYYPIDVLCLMTSLICVSQATIVAIFGPSMALTAKDPEAMLTAVRLMKEQQGVALKVPNLITSGLYSSILT